MLRDLSSDQNIDFNNYERGKILDKNRKEVYEATNKTTKEEVIFNEIGSYEAAPMFNDFKKFYMIHHPGFVNILNMQFTPKNSTQEEDKLIIIYEKMSNGEIIRPITQYFKTKGQKKEKMNPTIRNKIIFGVLSTINFCQENQIPYQELNLTNIYLDENYEPRISIGYSIYMYTNLYMTCVYEHAIFKPPEYFKSNSKNEKYCVYQFGIFIYYMFCPGMRLYKKEIKKQDTIPDVYWDLILRCIKEDPNERPTLKQLIEELKDDKYLLSEFGLKANPNEVHQYQKKIEENDNVHHQFSSLMEKTIH